MAREDFKPVEIAMTSDLILNNEDNKAKNPNNKGFRIEEKKKIDNDVDNQHVKGIDVNFSEVVKRKIQEDNKKNQVQEEDEDNDIPANEFKKAEPLIPILGYDIVKKLFSKNWRSKEDGLKLLSVEIQNYPNSDILRDQSSDKIITAVVGASAYILNSTISQVSQADLELLKIMFNKFRGIPIQGYLRQEFSNYVDQCLILMLEKIGDSNLKLKEKAENTVIEFANNPLIGHKIVFEHLVTGQIKKTLINSAKHLSSRLNLITRMIENFGLNLSEVPIDTLMSYAINGFKNANKEVRDAAYNLIMNIYKYLGGDIRSYFKELRPAQINTLEEGFESLEGEPENPQEEVVPPINQKKSAKPVKQEYQENSIEESKIHLIRS